MKKVLLFAAFTAALAFAGCSDKHENDEIMRFYLSQPRDPELVGWWVQAGEPSEGELSIHYYVFNADGTAWWVAKNLSDGKLFRNPVEYWYAKDGVYHVFERHDSWAYGNCEYDTEYEVRGDELWINNPGVGWMVSQKRTEPQQ